jgi:DNA-binding MarR family transcriptional regulator
LEPFEQGRYAVAPQGNFSHPLPRPPAQNLVRRRLKHARNPRRLDDAMAPQRAIEGKAADNLAAGEISNEHAPLKLEHFLPYQLNVVSSLVSQALSRVYARRYGIGVPEWRVLVTLGQYGVMTAKAVGAHTHMHKTKVSRAVALMEKRRLVARHANRDDMREAFLSLTAAGRAMYQEVAPHALDFARRLTEILTPGDRDAFNRALDQLTARSAQLVAEVGRQDEDEK